jgi:excisionase family DNA binding protein
VNQAKDTLNVHQAAAFLGCHEQTVRRLARKGHLPAYKVGQDWRFLSDTLQRWMDTHHERSRQRRILIVDDEPMVCTTLRKLLKGAGYNAVTAPDGKAALELMAAERPDLVLLDLLMPVMNGPTVLARIRETYGDMPVIVITAYADSELMSHVLDHGPVLVLAKPVEQARLLQGVQMALRVPQLPGG